MLEEIERWSSEQPGPSHYRNIPKNARGMLVHPKGAGKISTAKPKSELDWAIHEAKQSPAPGHSQQKCGGSTIPENGGKISTANPKSELDWKLYEAKQSPAPGDASAAFGGSTINLRYGGKISTAKPKSELD